MIAKRGYHFTNIAIWINNSKMTYAWEVNSQIVWNWQNSAMPHSHANYLFLPYLILCTKTKKNIWMQSIKINGGLCRRLKARQKRINHNCRVWKPYKECLQRLNSHMIVTQFSTQKYYVTKISQLFFSLKRLKKNPISWSACFNSGKF